MGFDKKIIVVSAVNFTEGGPLTILKNCLSYLDSFVKESDEYRVIAFVHDRNLFSYENIEYLEIKKAKTSWFYRLYVEYFLFNKISKEMKPYMWFSLHDITPRVKAEKRVVYCHNPSPFYKMQLKDLWLNSAIFLFSLFYKYLYKINIKKNSFIVVQQNWMREQFVGLYNLKRNNIIVSYPDNNNRKEEPIQSSSERGNNNVMFFFPSLARSFKNFEIICESVILLNKQGLSNFRVILTIDGTENSYSNWLFEKYKNVDNIVFKGLIPHAKVLKLYPNIDCLIFPSRLETWGLPISEFSVYNKPMLLADLPYAYETASNAEKVSFFDPLNSQDLASKMLAVINKDFRKFSKCDIEDIKDPFVQSWQELFKTILK